MNAIVAVDNNWAIGNKGNLLIRIPMDMKLFRSETLGKIVVLGRKTMDTFPGGCPLPDRTNVVLTANKDYTAGNAIIMHSMEEVLEYIKDFDSSDVYIIGGESVYRQFLPYVDTVHVTKIDMNYEADAYFPNLDADPDFEITAESEEQVYFDTTYTFLKYERRQGLSPAAQNTGDKG